MLRPLIANWSILYTLQQVNCFKPEVGAPGLDHPITNRLLTKNWSAAYTYYCYLVSVDLPWILSSMVLNDYSVEL